MAAFSIPEDKRLALVDVETWLFPKPTMDALREVLAQDAVDPDVVLEMVRVALGERGLEMRAGFGEIEYRTGPNDPWKPLIQLADLHDNGSDIRLNNHIHSPLPHEAYDDMPDLKLLFENGLV